MGDLIQFPGKRQRTLAAYELRRFAPDGSIQHRVSIETGSDAEAREQARRLSEGCRAELWSSGRLLDHFAPGDHPVATSIRLLSEPLAPLSEMTPEASDDGGRQGE
ncbi:MAG: hypothetical protein INR70_04890 [Parafilimonas terrae]|jgi:hypothetical protein|nr:hypothetical protein [Parafilimonas terrae]